MAFLAKKLEKLGNQSCVSSGKGACDTSIIFVNDTPLVLELNKTKGCGELRKGCGKHKGFATTSGKFLEKPSCPIGPFDHGKIHVSARTGYFTGPKGTVSYVAKDTDGIERKEDLEIIILFEFPFKKGEPWLTVEIRGDKTFSTESQSVPWSALIEPRVQVEKKSIKLFQTQVWSTWQKSEKMEQLQPKQQFKELNQALPQQPRFLAAAKDLHESKLSAPVNVNLVTKPEIEETRRAGTLATPTTSENNPPKSPQKSQQRLSVSSMAEDKVDDLQKRITYLTRNNVEMGIKLQKSENENEQLKEENQNLHEENKLLKNEVILLQSKKKLLIEGYKQLQTKLQNDE